MPTKRKDKHAEFGDDQLRALGRRLRELREARSWSLRRMAAESGVSVAAIQSIESGGANPSLVTVLALAESIGEPVDRLIASSRAATLGAHLGQGRLGDLSADLVGPSLRPRMAARLLVLPARRGIDAVAEDDAVFYYLLDGRVRFSFADGGTDTLDTGDSLHLAAGLAQRCTNLLNRRSRILLFTDRREPADRLMEIA